MPKMWRVGNITVYKQSSYWGIDKGCCGCFIVGLGRVGVEWLRNECATYKED